MRPSTAHLAEDRPPQTYYTSIPLAVLSDPRFARRYAQHEAPRLREIRKRLDAEPPTDEVDAVSCALLFLDTRSRGRACMLTPCRRAHRLRPT